MIWGCHGGLSDVGIEMPQEKGDHPVCAEVKHSIQKEHPSFKHKHKIVQKWTETPKYAPHLGNITQACYEECGLETLTGSHCLGLLHVFSTSSSQLVSPVLFMATAFLTEMLAALGTFLFLRLARGAERWLGGFSSLGVVSWDLQWAACSVCETQVGYHSTLLS